MRRGLLRQKESTTKGPVSGPRRVSETALLQFGRLDKRNCQVQHEDTVTRMECSAGQAPVRRFKGTFAQRASQWLPPRRGPSQPQRVFGHKAE
jgi:hypothetical protein